MHSSAPADDELADAVEEEILAGLVEHSAKTAAGDLDYDVWPVHGPVGQRREERAHYLEGAKVIRKGKERSLVRTFSGAQIVVKNTSIKEARRIFAKRDRVRQKTMLQAVGKTMEDVMATRIQAQIRGHLVHAGYELKHAGTTVLHAGERVVDAAAEAGDQVVHAAGDLLQEASQKGTATVQKEETPREEKKKSSMCALL